MLRNLGKENSLAAQYVAELRDVDIQNDRMRFRQNLERLGNIFAYEISKEMDWEKVAVTTPLGEADCKQLTGQPVLATILRAGLPLHNGLLHFFDQADNAFVAAYRRHDKDGAFDIHMEYITSPPIKGRVLIVSDPMLATGASLITSLKQLISNGKPSHTHVVTAIASREGVEALKKNFGKKLTIWAGAVDEELTAKAYIVPGLGDAGDLAFGEKVQD